ncbi:MAG: COX15/CtaA family protein [Longimonas sp.]|uniref:COX15/CtaA family protein n=1 Tax=Longimonas sp. TaxID=2039626 RepID=UPI003357ED3A
MSEHTARWRWTWRRRFTYLTIAVTATLISWGGWVTSIEAGLAVPDWPATFGSYDPFRTGMYDPNDPSVRWWLNIPVLAEHGHRLLGALVGMLTMVLAGWTWWADSRNWMRKLGLFALFLVTAQGILGGLRVTELSSVLAAVHACTAQLFFALLVSMAIFTTDTWRNRRGLLPNTGRGRTMRALAWAAAIGVYIQIVVGAMLRHSTQTLSGSFAILHIAGAFVVTGLIFAAFVYVQKHWSDSQPVRLSAWVVLVAVGVQFALGLAAYLVLIHETALQVRSTAQVLLTVSHLVVGAILFVSTIALALWSHRLVPTTDEVQPAFAGDTGAPHSEPLLSAEPPASQSSS